MTEDDVEIVFTGIRPGEKLYEELYFDDEERQPTPHPKLFVAYHRPYTLDEVEQAVTAVAELSHAAPEVLRLKIKELVAEYSDTSASAVAGPDKPEPAAPGSHEHAVGGASNTTRAIS